MLPLAFRKRVEHGKETDKLRRRTIATHKSLRHMPFRMALLAQGLLVVVAADWLLLWQMRRVLAWHSRAVEELLQLANVPWKPGRELRPLPGITAVLLRTAYADYGAHPLYPVYFFGVALALFAISYRRCPAPLQPLLFLVPAGLGITLLYQHVAPPGVPYTPEDFCAIWYRGEAYLWLLLPPILALSFFILNVPLFLKIGWLAAILVYSWVWSAVRLALALATFHYFGSIWMPFFYFALGFLADFLYIVACYSLAMDRAATFLVRQKEVWQS